MNKFYRLKRFVCVILAASLAASLAACGRDQEASTSTQEESEPQASYTATPGSVHKSETVYVNLNASGTPEKVTVSDWIHTDQGEVRVTDQSDLTGIENVKDDTQPVLEGGKLIWNMSGTDLYYQGTSDKELPVKISIRYELDGKELQPEEIAGKSGRVKITVTVQNNTAQQVMIDGKMVTVCAPVALVGGGIFPESKFSALSVENGAVFGDGSKQLAAFIVLPGLNDSLNLAQSEVREISTIRFPETFTITADAQDFTMGNMMFAMITSLPAFDTLAAADSVEEIKSTLYALRGMQSSLSQLNPDGALMDLFTEPSNMDTLTSLTAGLASLFDMNRALIQTIPHYVNQSNLELIGRITRDLQASKVLNVLTDSNVQSLIDRVGTVDYKQLKDLLSSLVELGNMDLDKIGALFEAALNAEELGGMLAASEELADTLADHPEQMALLGRLLGCTPEFTILLKQLTALNDQMDRLNIELTQEDLEAMVGTVIDRKLPNLSAPLREMILRAVMNQVEPLLETGERIQKKLGDLTAEELNSLVDLVVEILPDIPTLMEQLTANRDHLHALTDLLNDAETTAYLRNLAQMLTELEDQLAPLLKDDGFLKDLMAASSNPDVCKLAEFLPVLLQDLKDASPLLEALQEDLSDPEVQACFQDLPQTVAVLVRIQADLAANSSVMDALSGALNPDTLQTAGGLLAELDNLQSGVDLDYYTGVAETADMMLKRANAMLAIGQQHTIFTQKEDQMTSDLKFIMKTEEIRSEN